MGIIGLIVILVALVLIGVGIAVGLVTCGLAALLVITGVISTSVIAGIRSGRAANGLRLFFLQCGIFLGVPAGAVCAWLLHEFYLSYREAGDDVMILVYGGLGGAVAGILIGLGLDFISRRAHTWALARLPRKASSGLP